MKRILVTGGLGFIGSHLVDRLVEDENNEVVVIDNLLTGREGNASLKAQTIIGDITYTGDLKVSLPKFDVIVHTAATYHDPLAYHRDIDTNVLGTANMVEWAKENRARFIYLQTSLCYGGIAGFIRPETPVDPRGSYPITKTAGERFVMCSGLDWVSFRLANIYGPRNLSGAVPAFWKKIRKGELARISTARRDFYYVGDLVNILEKAVNGTGSGVYHVSNAADIPVASIFRILKLVMKVPESPFELIERSPDDPPTLLLDNYRTVREFSLHDQSMTPLIEGLRAAVNWYEENGVERALTHLTGDFGGTAWGSAGSINNG